MDDRAHHQRPDSWGDNAGDYERLFAPFTEGAAAAALERLRLAPGERFLDVAAGTGVVTLRAAAARARVTAIDFAPGMIDLLRAKLVRDGIGGVETRVMDGQHLDFEDGAFDAAGSNLGLIFFPEPGRALRELRRVLRPGGRVFITSLPAGGANPVIGLVYRAIRETVPDLVRGGASRSVQLDTADDIVAALREAGFDEAGADIASVPFPVRDPAEFWQVWVRVAPPTASTTSRLSPEQFDAAGRRFVELFVADVGGPFAFPTDVLIGLGRRAPGR